MSEIRLKSKLVRICDYEHIDVSEFAIPLTHDPERLRRDVANFLKKFAAREEAEQVEMEDMVTLSCTSQAAKYNKEHLTLRVGLKLFSRDMEEKLVGMALGETRTLMVDDPKAGQVEVTVSIEKIMREILPELTDELAEKSGLPGVHTAEDIYTYCRYKQYDRLVEEAADEAFVYVSGEIDKNSEFSLDKEEVAAAQESMRKIFASSSAFGGRDPETIPADEFAAMFGGSKEQFMESMERSGESIVKGAVLGQLMKEKEGAMLTEADYEAYIERVSSASRCSPEEAKAKDSILEYAINTYSEYYMDAVEAYAEKKVKEAGEWKARSSQN